MDIKNTLIDIIENGIWEINHDYGKIKRTDIVRLSKMVEDIPEGAEQGNNAMCVCPGAVFLKDDVLKIARAITSELLRYMDGDFTPYFFCEYCDAEMHGYGVNAKDFKHDIDCPVLVAQDILTRSEA